MFVAVWDSLAPRVQSAILEHKDQFQQDGPVLLYFVLRKYTGEQKNVLRSTLRKFDTLDETFRFAHKNNVDRFATYVKSLEEKLRESEGKDTLYHEKVYETLIGSHVEDFNSELKVWRSGEMQQNDTYTCDALLSKAREHYHSLLTRGLWPRVREHDTASEDTKRKKRKRAKKDTESDPADIAALFSGLIKAQEAQTKALTASFSSSSKRKYENNRYSYDQQYGVGKTFKERHEFMKWVHTKPTHGNTKELHGTTWTWCNICEKMGYHTSAECKSKRAVGAVKKRTDAHANSARVRKNKHVIDSSSEEEQMLSDSDYDDRKPRARR